MGPESTARVGVRALVLATAAFLVVWVWAWVALPAYVAVHHVGLDGPDAFGSRAGILLPLALLGPVMMIGLRWVVAAMIRGGDGAMLNYPHKDYWFAPERRDAFRRRVVGELDLLWAGTLALLTVGIVDVVRLTDDPDAGSVMYPALGVYVVFLGWWCWWMFRRAQPPRD